MSEELKVAEVWYDKKYECPHCGEVGVTDENSFDMEICEHCGEEFELGKFSH